MSKGFVACCLFILNFCLLTFEPRSNKAFPFLHRIKDIYSFEREGQHVIVTASSDGYIKMWNLDLNKVGLLNCLLPAWKNIRQPKLQTVLLQRLLLNKWGSLTRNLGVLCSVQERRVCLRTCFHVLVWVCIFNAFWTTYTIWWYYGDLISSLCKAVLLFGLTWPAFWPPNHLGLRSKDCCKLLLRWWLPLLF